jgi:autotransporter-associated beta strand protein
MNIKQLIPLPVVALAAMYCAPAAGFAQSVLLTAGNFALLGGTAITSTGTTGTNIITGNVGLSPGATSGITGFPPAVITGGGAIIATGAVTAQARLDLITASVALARMPSNVNMSNVNLGGTTLAPGVYTFNGAADLTGALVLDAKGQNGVAWVFQIGTSLTTAINASVKFVNLGSNGGSDLGVFWDAGSAITIGANNTIAGNYLAGTSITFGSVTSGGARALALAGISLDNNTVNAKGGPAGGDLSGGLVYSASGAAVALPGSAAAAGSIVVPGGIVTPGGVVSSAGTVVAGASAGVSGSVLLGSTGVYAKGTSGMIMTPGTPVFTTMLTVDGNMANGASPASLHVTAATVTLSGANTYTGGTTVDAGALITGSANLPANGPVALTNSSALIFNQAVDGAFGGVISGSGSVTKLGAGALTVSGGNTYTGGTVVTGGTLIASTSALPGGQNVSVASGGILAFNQSADGTFSGRISGSGTVQKRGAAALTLTNITSSAVDLQAGALFFNGGIGTTTIANGAFLGGTGTVSGNLTNNGTLSPGYSPGTINVAGNYAQGATGRLVIQLASGTSFDQLLITGTASLAGTLQIDVLNGFNPNGQSFTLLTATGGVSGKFDSVSGSAITTNHATTAAGVIYSANSVTFSLVAVPFATFALTPNQRAVANAAQASPALTAAVNVVPATSQLPAAFNALSPQVYENWSDFSFARATSVTDSLTRETRALPGHDDYYFDASQSRGNARRDLDVGSSTFTTTSGLVGVDHVVDANRTIGGFFNYGETVAGLGQPGSRTSMKSKLLGLRAVWNFDQWYANAAFAYGWDRYSGTRPVVFPGTAAVATAGTQGHEWLVDLSAGRHFTHGIMSVSPFAGLLVSGWRADGFTETGAGVYDNRVNDQAARSLRTQLGLEGRMNWEFGSLTLQPHVRAAWLSEFSNGARAMGAALDGISYVVATRAPQRDAALFNAGLDVVLNPRALLYTDFTAQSGGTLRYYTDWRVGAAIRF